MKTISELCNVDITSTGERFHPPPAPRISRVMCVSPTPKPSPPPSEYSHDAMLRSLEEDILSAEPIQLKMGTSGRMEPYLWTPPKGVKMNKNDGKTLGKRLKPALSRKSPQILGSAPIPYFAGSDEITNRPSPYCLPRAVFGYKDRVVLEKPTHVLLPTQTSIRKVLINGGADTGMKKLSFWMMLTPATPVGWEPSSNDGEINTIVSENQKEEVGRLVPRNSLSPASPPSSRYGKTKRPATPFTVDSEL